MLVKKPDEIGDIQLPQAQATQPSKPEVYFIKYKTQHGGGASIGGGISSSASGSAISSQSIGFGGNGGAVGGGGSAQISSGSASSSIGTGEFSGCLFNGFSL